MKYLYKYQGKRIKNSIYNFFNAFLPSIYFSTTTIIPLEWQLISGAYIFCNVVIPFENVPALLARTSYSKT